jgi:hypothetical protein
MSWLWDDFDIEFIGFLPSHLAQSSIFEASNTIRDMSPSESFVKMSITKTPKAFHGKIHITTANCRDLTVEATEKTLAKVMKSLVGKMEKTMQNWHLSQNPKTRTDYVYL